MKNLTSSVYTFEKLIDGNFLYVDKTEYIWKLIQPAYAQYFLSRPRRFGKSLTVSTLEAIFQGKRELFKGLALYDKPYDWKQYPVIHLDFGDIKSSSPEQLEDSLQQLVAEIAAQFEVPLKTSNAQAQFRELVLALGKNEKIVILIDEYDKPILGNVTNPEIDEILKELKGFFSVVKATEPYQRFVLLTGVSKFSHVSIFSDLNNLTDITAEADFATMLGYTQEELEYYLGERIGELAERSENSKEEMLSKIKAWYNGYRFHADANTVYNPVSLASFFRNKGEFNNYWFQTGTPTFLLKLMKERDFNYSEALTSPVSGSFFNSFEISNLDPLVLLYQTGYLTIDKAVDVQMPYSNRIIRKYYLHFPNLEVEESFNECVLDYYVAMKKGSAQQFQEELVTAVGDGNVDKFMDILKSVFANIPYSLHLKGEQNYQTVFYVICDMLRLYVQAKSYTNDGRIDMVVEAGNWVYILEFKLDQSAEKALKQIHEKNYAQKFRHRGKRIMLIGVNFDSESGQIEKWISEELKD